ncbi:MAG: hypothetical protein RIS79_1662, partial [Verrucomicrobiota bacterium]
LAQEPFDAVILDVGLPNMDGYTVVEQMRTRGFRMPVLFLTARENVTDCVLEAMFYRTRRQIDTPERPLSLQTAMLSKLIPEHLPSTWRRGIMLAILMTGSTALYIAAAIWAMKLDLSSITRAVVLDDLGEYAVLYNRSGLKEIKDVFTAGGREDD